MTLIVGVVCSEGIVFGSDSQTTIGGELKRINKQSPKVIELSNKSVLFAGAGNVSVLQEVEDKANLLLLDCPLDKGLEAVRDKIDDLIFNIMRKHISKHSTMYGNLNNMPSGDFIFGSWKDQTPLLCHFNIDGSSEKVDDYIALGSGMPYAEVLLKDSYHSKMSLEDSKRLVYDVIRDTEDVDNFVGGNINIKVINLGGDIIPITGGEIEALANTYELKKDIEKKLNQNWQKFFPKIVNMLEEDKIKTTETDILKTPIESNLKPKIIDNNKKEVKI